MVRINGGTFMMGSPEDETRSNVRAGETQHSVTVSSFYMAKYEVTQKEYLEITGKRISSVIEGGERITGDDLPVEGISWYDAVEYCNRRSEREGLQPAYTINKNSKDPNNKNNNDDELKWLVIWDKTANGYRLPTEAEWEYACRAGTTTRYNKGYTITTSQANYSLEYLKWAPPKAVGGFSPNAWGLYDMHGNVSEWCWDWYGRYPNSAQTNPTGPSSSEWRVNRGGSRTNEVLYARSASRNYWRPYFTMVGGGFRLVRNAQ
jgi:formylglycine-generating enzyme required for sulfatase activity